MPCLKLLKNYGTLLVLFLLLFSIAPVEAGTPDQPLTAGQINRDKVDGVQDKMLKPQRWNKTEVTPARKKMGFELLQLIDEQFLPSGQSREDYTNQMQKLRNFRPAGMSLRSAGGKTAGDLVYVYIYLHPNTSPQGIDPYVREITHRDEQENLVVAWVEVNNLEQLAAQQEVRAVRAVIPPVVRTGSVTSEGDLIHRADQVRSRYGEDGAGIKVGVISDGVDNWAGARATGDLPAGLNILSNSVGGDEGTAMLEIIHDLAPGAQLYFHDHGLNKTAFNQAIDNLVAAGCKVIVDDIGWITEPFFEDGTVARHVARVLAENDIIYISAAGNAGSDHYQGVYHNNGSNYHDFSGGASDNKNLYLELKPGESVRVVLQWDDQFGLSSNDYDLFLSDINSGSVLARSEYIQDGSGDPLEFIAYTNTGSSKITGFISVLNYQGKAAPKILELYIYGGNVYADNIVPEDSIFGHPAVPDALAVGAVNVSDPERIAGYSSRGPVTLSYPARESRNKPDLAGTAGGKVTGAGGFPSPFYGTSAAAPHVAGVAALIWAQAPDKPAGEIRNILLSTAADLGSPGFDYIFGRGRADALNAYQAGAPAVTPEVSLSLSSGSAAAGAIVTATATATGITSPVYQFWVKSPVADTWSSSGEFSGINSYTFTGSIPGTYMVVAYARPLDSPGFIPVRSSPASVIFTGTGSVSALTVDGPRGGMDAGSNATFTARAVDEGGIPLYQFWLHGPDGEWKVIQDYSTINTCTVGNLQPGSHTVAVYALDQADMAAGRWEKAYHQTFVINVGSSVQLNSPPAVSPGGQVVLAAGAEGLTSPVFQFWVQSPEGSWAGTDYTGESRYSFTADTPGTYRVIVYAKDPYAPSDDTHAVWSEVKTIEVITQADVK